MASKRRTDDLEPQPDCDDLLKKARGDVTCNELDVRARLDDAGPSHQPREAWLDVSGPPWPKHKVFLSHSGVQKAFTEHLCKELERVHHFPFFDRRADSLRKGERFYSPLMTAAQRCRVAVLVLSEQFFTASKWPMMELNEFVKAQKLDERVRILPLYFQISREELGKRDRQARWIEGWKVMASKDKMIDVEEWESALRQIAGNNGMAYGGNTEGEVAFIQRVVKDVCRLLPPDVKWDVSDVRSMKELSEPILRKLKDAKQREENNVQAAGLYGMGGAGKTTISRAICNEMLGGFVGKVCYIEFGKMEVEELLRIVLQELTEADPAILKDKHRDQLLYLLKERIHRQKVFLVLDNVVGGHECDAQMFLDVRYFKGSVVLVTSRSLHVLMTLGLQSDDCLEMPNLEEEGAIDMFLHYAKRFRESVKDEELKVIRGCVHECHFLKDSDPGYGREGDYHYLPLALKVLGSQLRSIGNDVFMLLTKLGELRKGKGEKFNMFKDKTHPVFSVLRLGFDALPQEEQHIFLDLVLSFPLFRDFVVPFGRGMDLDWLEWMGALHEKTKDEVYDSVKILERKGLLDSVYEDDVLKVNIHDLYKEFGEAESQGGPFERRHSLVSMEAVDRVPKDLLKYPPNGSHWPCLRRLVIWNSKVRNLTGDYMRFCRNVEYLDLRMCKELEVVDVTGMINLRCVSVYECSELREWIGFEKLQDLVSLQLICGFQELMPSIVRNLSSLTALQVLRLSGFLGTGADVQVSGNSLPKSLLKVYLHASSELATSLLLSSTSSLMKLQELSLDLCWNIKDLGRLCELTSLQKLDVGYTQICELPSDMSVLKHLQVLNVNHCHKLTGLGGISQCATTLRHLYARDCVKLRDLPDDFSCFQKLEILDLRSCKSICTLPKSYERLVGHPGNGTWILRPEGCFGIIVPLVKMLRLPKKCHVNCLYPCNVGDDLMQPWIDGCKHVNSLAYELLKRVLDRDYIWRGDFWTYMLEKGEKVDFLIRALCEHDERDVNGTFRLVNVVQVASKSEMWWMVVVTAPCTFGVVMKRAKLLEPWSKTLLHYTISRILPVYVRYLESIEFSDLDRNRMEADRWLGMAMKTLLQKCRENLEKAIDEGILPVHSREGIKVVDLLLRVVTAANGQGIGRAGTLRYERVHFNRRPSYGEVFPNFPFEEFLRRQRIRVYGEEDVLREEVVRGDEDGKGEDDVEGEDYDEEVSV